MKTIKLETKIELEVEQVKLSYLLGLFMGSLGSLFGELLSEALLHYGEHYRLNGKLNKLLGHSYNLTWQNLNGKKRTVLYTIFGKVWIPQLLIKWKDESGKTHTRAVTRLLLEVSRFQRIDDQMKHWMGVLSSLCSYRTAAKLLSGLGFRTYAYGSFRRSVSWVSTRLELGLSQMKRCLLLADGTGITTLNTGKRGSELKVVCEWVEGQLRLVNIGIGKYKQKAEWVKLFSPIKQSLETAQVNIRQEVAALADGCQALLAGIHHLDERLRFQRDIWHITHQLKYYLWKDGVLDIHKMTLMKTVFSAAFAKSDKSISQRLEKLATAILLCDTFKYKHCQSYLMGLAEHLTTHQKQANWELPTAYTSKIERMMRTINQRMDIGVWSEQGALDIAKIRLAHFYNGISLSV